MGVTHIMGAIDPYPKWDFKLFLGFLGFLGLNPPQLLKKDF